MDVVRQKLATIKKNYDHETYKFNPKYFECYDSAQTHTVKYRMPALVKKALMALPVVALLGSGKCRSGSYYHARTVRLFSRAAGCRCALVCAGIR